MTPLSRIFAYGSLEENGDTWLLLTRDRRHASLRNLRIGSRRLG